MRASRLAVLAGLALLAPAAPAVAAPELTVNASHAAPTFLRGTAPNTTVYSGTLTLTVSNAGADPTDGTEVRVTDQLPTGLSQLISNPAFGAGPTAATGPGWTCTGTTTSTCVRSDALAPGASYPPITLTVSVANSAPATVTNAPSVIGGGDTTAAPASDAIAVAADQCQNGYEAGQPVAFGPPSPVINSGVANRDRADGCSLLDVIWSGPPGSHDAFVERVDAATVAFGLSDADRAAVHNAAAQSLVGTPADQQPDTSCTAGRIALTFDDGPSSYRPQTMQNMRDKLAHVTLYDTGVRTEANPDIARFERAEGHIVLSHTYDHPHLNALNAALQQAEMNKAEETFNRLGLPITFRAMRPPFFEANAAALANLASMGYPAHTSRIETTDYEPANTPVQTANAIINQFRPGAIILLHDGPIDTPAGANSRDAAPLIIDAARARGYCMGVMNRAGNVVADRYVSTDNPIPVISNPVPYVPLARAGTPPSPYVLVPQPLKLKVARTPQFPARGSTGNTITLTVTNVSSEPTDGSTTTVRDQLPSGLAATAASGPGWTCTGTGTRTCTRGDVLAPGASFPPVTITYNVSATAAMFLASHTPSVTGHGGNVWVDNVADPVSLGVPATGDVGGSVPATLNLTLGAPATFGTFVPGVAATYTASTTANVISTAGDAALTVSEPGRLMNGTFSLASPLDVTITPNTWSGPVSNAVASIAFSQPISAGEPLRTGAYTKTLTFTLSTTTP